MVDRIIELTKHANVINTIRENGYAWFVEGENDDYIPMEAVRLAKHEGTALMEAAATCYGFYKEIFDAVVVGNLWSKLEIPEAAVPLIKYSWEQKHPHLLGRFDFAGGLDDIPIKMIEFNADTCTQLPEAAYIQQWLYKPIRMKYQGQANYLAADLERALNNLRVSKPELEPTFLLTSLGYIEDKLNLEVIKTAAEKAGFQVAYADLEDVIFDEDAVLLQEGDEYIQYNFMYKLVPWEFIIYEEPELLEILTDLVMNHNLIVLNPAHSIVFQSKNLMSIIYKMHQDSPYLLRTHDNPNPLKNIPMVEKVNFGRLGENIKIIDKKGNILEETDGDWGHFSRIYQEYATMFEDLHDEIYQAGVYVVEGRPSCIAFRRQDSLIIGDDSEFVAHVLD